MRSPPNSLKNRSLGGILLIAAANGTRLNMVLNLGGKFIADGEEYTQKTEVIYADIEEAG